MTLGSLNYVYDNAGGALLLSVWLLYIIVVIFSNVLVCVSLFFGVENSNFLKVTRVFFSGLPLGKKFLFLNFCFFYAFPNSITVNNGFTFIGNFFVNSAIVLAAFASPFLVILFLVRFILITESVVFASFYHYSQTFKNIFIGAVFGGDRAYAEAFILRFYGNPIGAGIRNGVSLTGSGLFGFCLSQALDKERKELNDKVELRVASDCKRVVDSGGQPLTLRQIMDARAEHRADLLKDAPLTSVNDAASTVVRDAYDGVRRWYLGPAIYDAEMAKHDRLKKIEFDNVELRLQLREGVVKAAEYEQKFKFGEKYPGSGRLNQGQGVTQSGAEIGKGTDPIPVDIDN